MAKVLRKTDLGPLHDLLLRACPPMKKLKNGELTHDPVNGIKSIAILAQLHGMTPWGVHLWIKKGRIPPKKAKAVVDNSRGAVTLNEFSPFIFD